MPHAMNPMDAQRYDLSKCSPNREENKASDAAGACSVIRPVVHHDASSIKTPCSPLLRATRPTLTVLPPPLSQQWDASTVPLPLSPLLSPSCNTLMEDSFPIPDALDKDTLAKFRVSSKDDFKSHQIPERPFSTLVETSPRVSLASMRPMRPLFLHTDSPEVFSRPGSPSPMSPPLNPQSRPTSPRFWKSACSSPLGWPQYPLSPPCHRFDDLAPERWGPMSCPTSPVIWASNPLPSPTSPSACHAKYSIVSRRLRTLGSTSSENAPVQKEMDPTEGIRGIKIMVTKEISVRIDEPV